MRFFFPMVLIRVYGVLITAINIIVLKMLFTPFILVLFLTTFNNVFSSLIYNYVGPALSSGDHLVVSFTTTAPLAPSKSYITQASAGVTSSFVNVVNSLDVLKQNFHLPLTAFEIHTDANGAIDSWFIFGEYNTLVNPAPASTGVDRQG